MSQPGYDLHPSVAYVQSVIDNLPAKTGKDLAAWLKVARQGPDTTRELAAWLKARGLGGTQAGLVAQRALARPGHAFDDTPEGYLAAAPGYVTAQYAGRKAALRPIFDAVVTWARRDLPGVRICPCETLVPLYRERVFAQLKPATQTRVDLGLALGDPSALPDPAGRLVDTGGFAKKDRLTVRIELKAPEDFDGEAQGWLRKAWAKDGS